MTETKRFYFLVFLRGDGVQSALNNAALRRSWLHMSVALTVPVSLCSEDNNYLGVELLTMDGSEDGWTDNDYLAVEVQRMQCDMQGRPTIM